MGIKVGKGNYDYSGVESLPKGARQPIEKPFPNSDSFRHGLYVIIEELDDYLICKGFDPNAKHPWTYHTVDVRKTIKVAKPPLLMRTPWEGDPVEMRVNGTLTDVTYVYDDDELGKRTASWTSNGQDFEEVQRIEMPYFVGDAIMAVEVRQSGGFDGLRTIEGPRTFPGPVTSEAGGRLSWMDLNNGGRRWIQTTDTEKPMLCKLTTVFASSEASAQRYEIDGTTTFGDVITVTDQFGVHVAAALALLTVGAKGISQPVAGGNLFYPLECA